MSEAGITEADAPHFLHDASGRAVPPFVAAFYEAYLSRDPARLEAVLSEHVEWQISGPADQFDMYGVRRGRDDVVELITRIIPCFFHITAFELEHMLVHGERAATYGYLRARQRDTGRALRFHFAHFMRFVDGKLIAFRGVADTFDAAQQIVGHRIDVTKEMASGPLQPEDEFSEV